MQIKKFIHDVIGPETAGLTPKAQRRLGITAANHFRDAEKNGELVEFFLATKGQTGIRVRIDGRMPMGSANLPIRVTVIRDNPSPDKN